MFQAKFKVPSYYKKFHCKGADCRNCCCQGWKVTLTQDEYFKVMDLDCSERLKEKIETYVGILLHPNEEEYARINFDFQGQCPLRLSNGYCGLQVECGEENIPSVCRYYPRSPKLSPSPECCISNSCEWVLEYLYDDNTWNFESLPLSFAFDDDEKKENTADYQKKRDFYLVLFLKDAPFLSKVDVLFKKGMISDSFKEKTILMMLKEKFSRSISISSFLENLHGEIPSLSSLFETLKGSYPELDGILSRILLNHLYYVKYPFVISFEKEWEECACLYLFIYFWLWILNGNLKRKDRNDFVDISASFFRVAEHSNLYDVIDFLVKNS